MTLRCICIYIVLVMFFCLTGCQNNSEKPSQNKKTKDIVAPVKKHEYATLPENIKWLTNVSDPVFSSDKAQKGGILHSAITSFPFLKYSH